MSDVQRIYDLVAAIRPLLAGEAPHVQGAVLADLVAMWLAGHVVMDSHGKTRRLRADLLRGHVAVVRELTHENAKELGLEP